MGRKADTVYLVAAVHNGEGAVGRMLSQWYPVVQKVGGGSRMVVIDDGSTDRTRFILDAYALSHGRLAVLHAGDWGRGRAILFGYHYAVSCGADYVFQLDPGGQASPRIFWPMWDARDPYRMVSGRRVARAGRFSWEAAVLVRKMALFSVFGEWADDADCPYRLMGCRSLRQVLDILPSCEGPVDALVMMAYAYDGNEVSRHGVMVPFGQGGKGNIRLPDVVRACVRDFAVFLYFRDVLSDWEGVWL